MYKYRITVRTNESQTTQARLLQQAFRLPALQKLCASVGTPLIDDGYVIEDLFYISEEPMQSEALLSIVKQQPGNVQLSSWDEIHGML